MKRPLRILSAVLCGTMLLSLLAGCNTGGKDNSSNGSSAADDPNKTAIAVTAEEAFTDVTVGGMTCRINTKTGMVTQVKTSAQTVDLGGLLIDVGYNKAMVMGQLGYQSFTDFETWKLPTILMKRKKLPDYTVDAIYRTSTGLEVSMTIDTLTITYVYEFMDGALKLTARLTSSAEENQLINAVAFLVRGIDMDKETSTFEYPGSTPAGVYSFKEYT